VEQQPPPQAQAVEQAEGRAVIACPACGEDVARDARFCDVCGFELESPPAGTAEAEADGRAWAVVWPLVVLAWMILAVLALVWLYESARSVG